LKILLLNWGKKRYLENWMCIKEVNVMMIGLLGLVILIVPVIAKLIVDVMPYADVIINAKIAIALVIVNVITTAVVNLIVDVIVILHVAVIVILISVLSIEIKC
jgi:hypothetical protein